MYFKIANLSSKGRLVTGAIYDPGTGNVGIGTANPHDIFHIRADNYQLIIEDSDNNKQWRLGTSGEDLDLYDETITRMTWKKGGNVGIGTANPQARLDVAGSGAALFAGNSEAYVGQHRFYTGTSNPGGQWLGIGASGTGAGSYFKIGAFYNAPNAPQALRLGTANADHMTIDTAGNVGIRTTAPGVALDVNGDIQSGSNSRIYLGGGDIFLRDAFGRLEIQTDNGTGSGGDHIAMLPGGGVGILTTSPRYALDVNGRLDAAYINSDNWIQGKIYYDGNDGNYHLDPNSNSRLANIYTSYIRDYGDLHVDGKVGIGTTPSVYKLEVQGNTRIYGMLYADPIVTTEYPGGPMLNFNAGAGSATPYTLLVSAWHGFRVSDCATCTPNLWVIPDNYDYQDRRGGLWVKGLVFQNQSDSRIKLDQQPMDYGLEEIMELQPKQYLRADWSVSQETGDIVIDTSNTTNDFGLVAQDVYEVIPEAVFKPEDENKWLWGLCNEKLVPVIIKAIQEQQQTIENLQTELQSLKDEIAVLKAK